MLGDLVDYCAEPNECIELVQKLTDYVIIGNHDEAQFDFNLLDTFSENAKISSMHTRSIVKSEYVEYFKTLPRKISIENMCFTHSSPFDPEYYNYILTINYARYNFKYFRERVCFIGHSHIPVIFEESNEGVKSVIPEDVKVGNRYIINVGNVGQSRDGDNRLCLGIFDSENFTYKLIRLEYDANAALEKIKHEGLPKPFAEILLPR